MCCAIPRPHTVRWVVTTSRSGTVLRTILAPTRCEQPAVHTTTQANQATVSNTRQVARRMRTVPAQATHRPTMASGSISSVVAQCLHHTHRSSGVATVQPRVRCGARAMAWLYHDHMAPSTKRNQPMAVGHGCMVCSYWRCHQQRGAKLGAGPSDCPTGSGNGGHGGCGSHGLAQACRTR